jgi:uncharacterized membrane protein YuzA (DUF378 family)
MLALLQTLFDIIRLRKGPDALPRSPILLAIVVASWLFVDILAGVVLPTFGRSSISGLAISMLGIIIYAFIATLYGRNARIMQMLTALIGCGAVLGLAVTLTIGVALQLQGLDLVAILSVLAVWSITLFSIVVDGHILSRTLDRPQLHGVIIAFLVFALQYYLSVTFNPVQPAAA